MTKTSRECKNTTIETMTKSGMRCCKQPHENWGKNSKSITKKETPKSQQQTKQQGWHTNDDTKITTTNKTVRMSH